MRWIVTGVVMIAALTVAACAGISKRPGLFELVAGYPETTLRMVSFNVDGSESDAAQPWAARRELVAQRLIEADADIVGLQDASPAQVRELLARLPGYAAAMSPEVEATATPVLFRTSALGVSGMVTFAISPTPRVVGSVGWGSRLVRSATSVTFEASGGRLVRVINAHLAEDSETARQRGAEMIARAISDGGELGVPVIVLGSLADTERSATLGLLTGRSDEGGAGLLGDSAASPRLLDTFRVRSTQSDGVGTVHGYGDGADGARVDYVLSDRSLRVDRAEIGRGLDSGRRASSHWPVFATLVIPGRARGAEIPTSE